MDGQQLLKWFMIIVSMSNTLRWPGGIKIGQDADDESLPSKPKGSSKAKAKAKGKGKAKAKAKKKTSSAGGAKEDKKNYTSSYSIIQKFPVSLLMSGHVCIIVHPFYSDQCLTH